MADTAAVITAINALTNAISLMRPTVVSTSVFDPFTADTHFYLVSRVGDQAYTSIAAPLPDSDIWDGSVDSFPSFVIMLQIRASKGKCDAAVPHGILSLGVMNLLSDYHLTTDTQVIYAQTARKNDRAIQHKRAMYHCTKISVKWSIRNTISTQTWNMPTNNDGVDLFKKLTKFTMVASLQLSLLSFNPILEFNPFDHKFNITTINTKLMNLFVLSTTHHRALDESKKIQHTLNVYSKIIQPETWTQWVRNKVDSFEEGTILVCQSL